MTLEELISLQDWCQPKLKPGDCLFIGPSNVGLLGPFINELTKILAPEKFGESTCHLFFSKSAVLKAIDRFPRIPLRIYVITLHSSDYNVLHYSTIEDYCRENGIEI